MIERQFLRENAHGRWMDEGTGAPVILIHGPTSPRLWRHVMPLVRGRCLAWEMPGYGSSIPRGADLDLSLSAQAGYVLDWIGSLDLGRNRSWSATIWAGEWPRSRPCGSRTPSPVCC